MNLNTLDGTDSLCVGVENTGFGEFGQDGGKELFVLGKAHGNKEGVTSGPNLSKKKNASPPTDARQEMKRRRKKTHLVRNAKDDQSSVLDYVGELGNGDEVFGQVDVGQVARVLVLAVDELSEKTSSGGLRTSAPRWESQQKER